MHNAFDLRGRLAAVSPPNRPFPRYLVAGERNMSLVPVMTSFGDKLVQKTQTCLQRRRFLNLDQVIASLKGGAHFGACKRSTERARPVRPASRACCIGRRSPPARVRRSHSSEHSSARATCLSSFSLCPFEGLFLNLAFYCHDYWQTASAASIFKSQRSFLGYT